MPGSAQDRRLVRCRSPPWLERELAIVSEGTDKPWGVGFLSWSAAPEVVERALEYRPAAVMLSFGNPGTLADPARSAWYAAPR
jgi:nitronate monooxygenase